MSIEDIYWRSGGDKGFYEQYEKKALAYTQLMREEEIPSGMGISEDLKRREGIWQYREKCVYYAELYDEYMKIPDYYVYIFVGYENIGEELYYEEKLISGGSSFTFPSLEGLGITVGEYDKVPTQWRDDSGNYYDIGSSYAFNRNTGIYFFIQKAFDELEVSYYYLGAGVPNYTDTIQVVNGVPNTYIVKGPDDVGYIPPEGKEFYEWRLGNISFNLGDEFNVLTIYDSHYTLSPQSRDI